MQRRDWALLAIACAEGKPLTPVQLQKGLFLLGKRMPQATGSTFYQFRPYNFGPFTAAIYEDAEALEREGLVSIDRGDPRRSWPTYAATPAGIRAAKDRQFPDGARDYLARIVTWARALSFQQLVSAVYEAYPEQRENSVFVD